MNRTCGGPPPAFTPLQGQYLAFIHAYTLVNGQPPAEHQMMRFFRVTPPSVHRMVVTLEQAGLISRTPGRPRTIAVRMHEDDLPRLKPGFGQTVKTTVTGYELAARSVSVPWRSGVAKGHFLVGLQAPFPGADLHPATTSLAIAVKDGHQAAQGNRI